MFECCCSSPARSLPKGRSKIHLITHLYSAVCYVCFNVYVTMYIYNFLCESWFPIFLNKIFFTQSLSILLKFPLLEYRSSIREPGSQTFTLELESTPFACSSSVKTFNHATGFPGILAHRQQVMRPNFLLVLFL